MPMYEYQCQGCKQVEETLQSMDEHEKGIDIPTCRKGCDSPMEPLVGMASIGLCDTTWWRDVRHTRDELDKRGDDRGKLFAKKAKEAGISTTGKVYMPNLAVELGDPEAWVGSQEDVQRVCQRRGWKYNGVKDGCYSIEKHLDLSKDIKDQTVITKAER